jgi:hypothetical protein
VAEILIALSAFVAVLVFVVVDRRRRARRVAAALERARRRHRRALPVSANLRGLSAGPDGDLWSGELRERRNSPQAARSSRDG